MSAPIQIVTAEAVAANSGEALTSVTDSWSTSWNIAGQVSDSWGTNWNVQGTVSDSWGTSWNVRGSVSDSWGTSWNIFGQVTDSWGTSWNIAGQVTDTWSTTWGIGGSVTDSWGTSWNVRTSVSDSWGTSWNIRSSVSDTWQTSWNTAGQVTDSWGTTWNVATPTLPKISTLQVNFNSIDPAVGFTYGTPPPSIVDGALRAVANETYPGWETVNSYDLHDSSIFIKMPEVPTSQPSGGQPQAYFLLIAPNGDRIEIDWTGHPSAPYLLIRERYNSPSYLYNDATVTYNATNHKWLKVTESAGTLTIQSSPDSSTWTNLRTPFARAGNYSQVVLALGAGTTTGSAIPASGAVSYDNINLPGVSGGWENNDPWNNDEIWDDGVSLTNVLDAWSTSWNTRASVADIWSTSWNVLALSGLATVIDSWSTSWRVYSDYVPEPPPPPLWYEWPNPPQGQFVEPPYKVTIFVTGTEPPRIYTEQLNPGGDYTPDDSPSTVWT